LGRKRFRYVDAHDVAITDEEQLERIEALAIPPAWTNVWVSPNPRARLQATGVDAAGRKQYRYHESYRAAQERAKFERLLDFAKGLPRFRGRTDRHLRLDAFEREWTCALAVGVINKAWFRVGSEQHARSSRTYGVTTLRKRHVTVDGDEIAFCFRAKNSKLVRRTIVNGRLAQGVEELLALPNGSRLFRFERDGELFNLTSAILNDYIGDNCSVLPTLAVPEMDGSVVFVGRGEVTTFVGFDVAFAEPSALLATTWLRMRKPASAWRSVYELAAAFEIRPQSDASGAPAPSQRNQRNAYVIGAVPVHVPRVVRRTWPTRVVPVTLGSPTFCGATAVAADDVAAQAMNTPPMTATAAATPRTAR